MPRPKLNPTAEQRKRVKLLAAVGTTHEEIARQIGVRSPKTLRKHFRDELDRGLVEANASVAGALYKAAMAGDVSAQKFWLSCRGGWHSQPPYGPGTGEPPTLIIAEASGGTSC